MTDPPTALTVLDQLLHRVEARDLEGALALMTEDAVFVDPHYPVMRMEGRDAIARGLKWGLDGMEKFGFEVIQRWDLPDGGGLETRTHHVLKTGQRVEVEQVFLFETRAGKISRLRAFLPYRPHGVGKLVAQGTHALWKLTRKV